MLKVDLITPRGSERSVELRVENVSKAFAGVQALRSVSCEVGRNEILGLIGPNGAGKTTLFNCLTGFLPIDSGEISFGDTRIDGWSPHRIAQRGVVRTFQNIRMFPDLTAFESLLVAQHARARGGLVATVLGLPGHRHAMKRMMRRAEEILDLVGLGDVRTRPCKRLTLLQQRKLELGRAIAAEPSVLLLDEPSAGATLSEAEELMEVIGAIRRGGGSVLVIEHNIPFVVGLADRISVLNFGEIVATGTGQEILENVLVREIYLGT